MASVVHLNIETSDFVPVLVQNIFLSTWWLPYIGFGIGFTAALYSKSSRANVEKLVEDIQSTFQLGGKEVPLHLKRAINKRSAKITYFLIKNLLLITLAWQFTVNLCMKNEEKEGGVRGLLRPIVNFLFAFYCLNTALVSAHDVLLHDDKSEWSDNAKWLHVMMPFDMESNKIFATPLMETALKTQMKSVKDSFAHSVGKFSIFAFLTLIGWKFFHNAPVLYIFMTPAVWYAHAHFLKVLDSALDAVLLEKFHNRYEHFFGDNLKIVTNGEAHEFFGKQYQYFLNYFKPFEKVCYEQFYKVAKNDKSMSVGEAKAVYYIGRGSLVLGSFLLLNAVHCDLKSITSIVTYYAIHAGIAYRNQDKDDWFDEGWKRGLAFFGEIIVAGYLFYHPLLKQLIKIE